MLITTNVKDFVLSNTKSGILDAFRQVVQYEAINTSLSQSEREELRSQWIKETIRLLDKI